MRLSDRSILPKLGYLSVSFFLAVFTIVLSVVFAYIVRLLLIYGLNPYGPNWLSMFAGFTLESAFIVAFGILISVLATTTLVTFREAIGKSSK